MTLVADQLNKLGLSFLENGWVQAIYNSEFLEFCDLPPEYEDATENLDVKSTFKDIINAINVWLDPERVFPEEKSWTTLSQLIHHEKVLAILAYYIDYGTKNVKIKEDRNNAIYASRVYYKLLSISGYKAYHIYHSQLFTNSLVCLNFPKAICEGDNFENSKELTRDVNSVIKELRHLVTDLRAISESLHLNPSDMNFEDILANLVDVTGGAIVKRLSVDRIELSNISKVIYDIINVITCDASGDPYSAAIRLLFKCLLPKLVASSLDPRSSNNIVRASYVTYSALLLTKYGKAALPGYILLLEHVTYSLDGLERADVRTARVNLVVGLMSLLPQKSYKKFVKWLLVLSSTPRISHRQIAMEILANLLSNDAEEEPPKELENANTSDEDNELSIENQVGSLQKNALSTDDESSQDSQILPPELDAQDMTNEEVAGLLRHRAHAVRHADILRAVYERVHDESSTLRMRAIAILTDCVDSDRPAIINAIKALSGNSLVSRLTAVGARSVCDERAHVRRAGAALLHRLLAARTAPPPRDTDLAILVNLCRDASIIVRSTAIAALGDLAVQRPSDAVFEAFLEGPMHQISDPETKVQEQVLSLIQQVLFDRLRTFEAVGADDGPPWMFLAGLTRRNMRRHLIKVCSLLRKSATCINHRTVDILSTHLGKFDDDRDLQCLVLLTSLAQHVEYSDINFILEYYYKLSENEESRDARLMPLTLDLVGKWARFAHAQQRSTLREHLVHRLAAATDDSCRILCASLAAQLEPDDLTWASELMQLSEQRALAADDMEEAMRAVDLSLVAPAPPGPELLALCLRALQDMLAGRGREGESAGRYVAAAGRLCLRSRDAAAGVAPALSALMAARLAPLPARVNSLLALADICVRYTCIVEPLLGSVCDCLALEAPRELRRAAARALTRLLLGGYLRLRTPLYYRYCALLSDEDPEVREPAEFYVTSCLTTDAIYHHFVDCVLHYNKEKSGALEFDARQLVYDVMLQRLSLVQRLNVQVRLARDVLARAADMCAEGPLEPAWSAALLDTITLLCGPRMKPPKKPQQTGEGNEIDDLQERVTTNIVSHKMKRTVAEVLVPAVLRLYTQLRPEGGQLPAYLVRIATNLLNDYRQEIEELIENDEELVERVQQFQETIGSERTFGNVRNLVTSTAPPEPDTPRRRPRASLAPRRAPRTPRTPRALPL